jgi:hypothetical protein
MTMDTMSASHSREAPANGQEPSETPAPAAHVQIRRPRAQQGRLQIRPGWPWRWIPSGNVRAGSAGAVAMQNLTPNGERTTENEAESDILENPPLDSSSVRPQLF